MIRVMLLMLLPVISVAPGGGVGGSGCSSGDSVLGALHTFFKRWSN
jgi:hypothetical protein